LLLTSFFPIILVTLLLTLALTPAAILAARKMGLVDRPGSVPHKRHLRPTPMTGGLVLIVTTLVLAIRFEWWGNLRLLGITVGAMLVFAFGLWDDRRNISPPMKIGGQFAATVVVLLAGTQVRLSTHQWINILISVIWMMGVTNGFNFVDSMDGLAAGLAGIAAAFFMLVTLESGQAELAILSAGIVGFCMGFYFFNLAPAKTFLGDSGAQQLGFILAAIGILYRPPDYPQLASWFVPIMVLGVPIFDMWLVVLSRLRRRRKIYLAAMDHTYHRLVGLGMDPTRAVYAMHLVAIGMGFLGFVSLNSGVLLGNLIFAMVVLAGLMLFMIFERLYRDPDAKLE